MSYAIEAENHITTIWILDQYSLNVQSCIECFLRTNTIFIGTWNNAIVMIVWILIIRVILILCFANALSSLI